MELTLPSPRRAAFVLFGCVGVLDLLYVVSRSAVLYYGVHHDIYPVRLVDFDHEGNLPSLFSGIILMTAAFLLACLASAAEKRDRYAWWLLALIFCFLSFDEWLGFHERLAHVMRWLKIGGSGFFRFAWVIPYGLAAAGLGALYVPFLLRRSPASRALFVASGALFVGGAVGCEMLSAPLIEAYGEESVQASVEFFFEETLEMAGVSLFIVSLLREWRENSPRLRVTLSV